MTPFTHLRKPWKRPKKGAWIGWVLFAVYAAVIGAVAFEMTR